MKKIHLMMLVVSFMMLGSVSLFSKCAGDIKTEKKDLKASTEMLNKDANATQKDKKMDPSLKNKMKKSAKCGVGKCG